MHFARQLLVRICAFCLTLALFSLSYLLFGDQSKTNPYHALLANYEVIVENYNHPPAASQRDYGFENLVRAQIARGLRRCGDYKEALRVASEGSSYDAENLNEALKASIALRDRESVSRYLWAAADLSVAELNYIEASFTESTPPYLEKSVFLRSLAERWSDLKEPARAISLLQKAIAMCPADPDLHLYLVYCYTTANQNELAERALDAGLEQCRGIRRSLETLYEMRAMQDCNYKKGLHEYIESDSMPSGEVELLMKRTIERRRDGCLLLARMETERIVELTTRALQ